jgi:hypothetical protein
MTTREANDHSHFENPRQRVRGHLTTDMSARRQKCEMQPADSFARKFDADQAAVVLSR